jgi:hypothetical protein
MARITEKGKIVGPSTIAVLEQIMLSRKYPELGYRSCLGVLRLGNRFTDERLESACRRALVMDACSYRSIKSILQTGLDRQPLQSEPLPATYSLDHINVRGAAYYRQKEVF